MASNGCSLERLLIEDSKFIDLDFGSELPKLTRYEKTGYWAAFPTVVGTCSWAPISVSQ
jgi:hypothetical protein